MCELERKDDGTEASCLLPQRSTTRHADADESFEDASKEGWLQDGSKQLEQRNRLCSTCAIRNPDPNCVGLIRSKSG